MPAYHQIGNDYGSLLRELNLRSFAGGVLSPVNYTQRETTRLIKDLRPSFEVIFDPQLYSPKSQRGDLPSWPYFPSDVDTADVGDLAWWRTVARNIASSALPLGVRAVCSPATVPGRYDDDYYVRNREIAEELAEAVAGRASVLQTVLVKTSEFAQGTRSEEIASIVSATDLSRVYLLFYSDLNPRREYSKAEELKGAMRLIRLLETSGVRVLVGYSSSDLILWKAAGATSCCTGKYLNLRRFDVGRFETSQREQGGGPGTYWFEEGLLAFIQEIDILRLRPLGVISETSQRNPYGRDILTLMERNRGERWLDLSWRQYLFWFADCEARLRSDPALPARLVDDAERNWDLVIEAGIQMAEAYNYGSWLTAWASAINPKQTSAP